MAQQFIHYETYGIASRNGKPTIWGVTAEAERVPTHSKHVQAAKPPKLLYGVNPSALTAELEQAAAQAKDRTGKRRLPKDAKILLAGVVSMPLKSADLVEAHRLYVKGGKQERPADLKAYQRWQKLTVAFLTTQYGDSLRSVLLHYDETYVHLHYYVSGKPKDGTLNLDGLDVAGDAERMLGMNRTTRNKSGAERKKVRTLALQAFQEKYYELVGKALGWTRSTAQKPYLNRREYMREKEREKVVAEEQKKSAQLSGEVANLSASLKSSRALYNEVVNDITAQVSALSRDLRHVKQRPNGEKTEQLEKSITALANKLKFKG